MFNPKENLLDQQLAVSGLEMNILQALPAIFAGVGAAASIVGGISASNQAKKQNKRAEQNAKEQREAAQEAADATNEYNAEAFAAEQINYEQSRKFQHETAIQNWKYTQAIRDYEYGAVVKRYGKSVENTENQLIFNSIAAVDAYAAEQAVREDMRVEDAFGAESSMVERLEALGQAQMGQAGVSRNKRVQSRLAKIGRDETVKDASLDSAFAQSDRNIRQIAIQKWAADQQAKASMMIKPEAMPDIPKPQLGPARIFVEPMEATPAYIPQPLQVSTMAPLISGAGSASNALAGVDWQGIFG